MRAIITVVVVGSLAACAPQAAPPAPPENISVAPPPAPRAPEPVLELDSGWADMPWQLQVTVSPAAAARIAELGEQMVIAADYYAEPHPDRMPAEPGPLAVGDERQTLDGTSQTVLLSGVYNEALAMTGATGEVRVSINGFTARNTHPDNILDCGVFDAALTEAVVNGGTLNCKLIGE